ncbi:TPA: ATP-binding cassette domain-containing protein, partial [Streptococcus equi subsp. equi]|nr:ATP-binding cassette domain-containing protein [Streptococcus equi subsp. equi]
MAIEVLNVTKKFGSKKIFTDLNLTFEAGKSYALIGGSGSGKSTLLNIIGRLEKIDSGKVLVDEQDIWKTKERTFFKTIIGYVFQNYTLIENKTVYDNLRLINKDKKIIADVLEKVGL